ncbi:hypothetical protein QFC21_004160 [Naganishia friedmannii]|uniref:Uncharacterized protein n=1 Tax=Naganishia friedmannii TaxID=89922 RepID=A0ACC2VIQ5_9TREE|nr:hypothetical protein QFC21_004160 [Naganishia friedmannii]
MARLPTTTALFAAALVTLTSCVNALQYYIGNPAQCQPLNLTWSDAKGRLHLLIVPTVETSQGFIQNITLPSTATSPYTFTNFTQPAGMDFMAVMWDDEGYSATGVTDILTVGSSDNNTCLIRPGSVLPDFFFYTSAENPAQCSNIDITWQATYTPPASIVGMIPRGDIWDIHSISGSGMTSYTWRVDVREGTRMLLTMPDAGPIGTGGSTGLWTIGSGASSCLSSGGHASITASATQTSGSSATPSVSGIGGGGGRPGSTSSAGQSGNGGNGASSSKGSNIGAIVGGVVGGAAALVILALLAFFLLRRRKRQSNKAHQKGMYITPGGGGAVVGTSGGMFDRGRRNPQQADIDLLGAGEYAHGQTSEEFLRNSNHDDSPGSYEPQPYITGFPYANTTTAPTSSGINGTRTSHESQPMSDTIGSRSRPQSYGISDFGNFASSESEGAATAAALAHPHYPSGMSSVSGPVTGASPQLPGSPSLPITSMYPSPNSPSAPLMESSNNGQTGTAGRSNSTRKRRAAAPVGPDGRPATRFVLHQDAGEIENPGPEEAAEGDVVEMPPRYDELRPGAKASVENLSSR